MRPVKIAALALAIPFAVACGGDDDGGVPPVQDEVNPAGAHNTFVLDSLTIPESVSQAQQLGLDLDGDELGRPDNALGNILSALASAGGGDVDLQTSIDESVAFGDLVLLTSVQATALSTATGVGLWVFLGSDPANPAACLNDQDTVCGLHLDGDGSFDISADSPTDALVVGQNIAGKFTGGPGTITLQLSLIDGTEPITLNLVGARAEFNVTADGITNGKLAGAITDQDLQNTVLPAIADLVQSTIEQDCTGTFPDCCAEEGTTGETLLGLFDENPEDCMVSLQEVQESSIISSLLAPDVDLFDCPSETSPLSDCTFNPRQDEFNDALSLGLGFTATTGTYTIPPNLGQ